MPEIFGLTYRKYWGDFSIFWGDLSINPSEDGPMQDNGAVDHERNREYGERQEVAEIALEMAHGCWIS